LWGKHHGSLKDFIVNTRREQEKQDEEAGE
jgi:hypothetical protein